jgi:hypothetical protein
MRRAYEICQLGELMVMMRVGRNKSACLVHPRPEHMAPGACTHLHIATSCCSFHGSNRTDGLQRNSSALLGAHSTH